MQTHRIIATDWQLKAAAAGQLRAIVLPLVPEPVKEGNTWVWTSSPVDLFWFDSEGVGDRLIKRLPYQKGDRLYLAEEWCKGDWGTAFDDDIYFPKSTVPEAEHIGWQPAETMPEEAAEHWFEVTGLRVVQMKEVTFNDFALTGIHRACPGINYPKAETVSAWNTAHPGYPWDGDRHVIVLEVAGVP
jgi:hypothetical protein